MKIILTLATSEMQGYSQLTKVDSRLYNLEVDLHMQGNDYNLALCLFFITYHSPQTDLIKGISCLKSRPTSPYEVFPQHGGFLPSSVVGESYPLISVSLTIGHDLHGIGPQSHRPRHRKSFPRIYGSWILSRCQFLSHALVPSIPVRLTIGTVDVNIPFVWRYSLPWRPWQVHSAAFSLLESVKCRVYVEETDGPGCSCTPFFAVHI